MPIALEQKQFRKPMTDCIAIKIYKIFTTMVSNPLRQLKNARENNIAVVAHDAGAAKLLFSWLREFQTELIFYVEGPAKKILDAQRASYCQAYNLEECIANSNIVISGTGLASDLEFESRLIAKRKRKRALQLLIIGLTTTKDLKGIK